MYYNIKSSKTPNDVIAHSKKNQEWKKHKYIRKEGDRYIYEESTNKEGTKSVGNATNIIKNVSASAKTKINSILSKGKAAAESILSKAGSSVVNVSTNIKEKVADAKDNIADTVSNTKEKITNAVSNAKEKVEETKEKVEESARRKGEEAAKKKAEEAAKKKAEEEAKKKAEEEAKKKAEERKIKYESLSKETISYLTSIVGKDAMKNVKTLDDLENLLKGLYADYVPGETELDDFVKRKGLYNELKDGNHLADFEDVNKDSSLVIPPPNEKLADENEEAVNPNYNPSEYGYSNNCAYCTLTYEMRCKGYDVEASSTSITTANTIETELSWYGLEDGWSEISDDEYKEKYLYNPEYSKNGMVDTTAIVSAMKENKEISSSMRSKVKDTLSQRINNSTEKNYINYPMGISSSDAKTLKNNIITVLGTDKTGYARGNVNVQWYTGGGHSIAYEVVDNEVYIRDCQSNGCWKIEDYPYLSYITGVDAFRTDNRELTTEALNGVKNREDK